MRSGSWRKKLVCAALCAAVLCTVPFPMEARADAAVEGFWNTAYDVDYDVEVSAPDGDINFRSGAGAEYSKIINGMIPNGTRLHIDVEARADNGKLWGRTYYQGDYGWVFLGQTKRVTVPQTTAAAVPETPQTQPYGIGRVIDDTETEAAETLPEPYVPQTEWEEPDAVDLDMPDIGYSGSVLSVIGRAMAVLLQMKMILP